MSRWRCRLLQPRLVDYAEGALAARRAERLERHLAGCAACRSDLAALRTLPALLRRGPQADPGEAFWLRQRQAIAGAVASEPAAGVAALRWWQITAEAGPWRYGVAAAAALLLAVGVYRVVEWQEAPSLSVGAQLAALDSDDMTALRDVVQTLVPADSDLLQRVTEALPPDRPLVAAPGDELPLSDLVGLALAPQEPQAVDLSAAELESIHALIGGREQ